jgi:phage tail-like protein
MAPGRPTDPYRSYNFLVEIDGIARAAFREASGLDTTQAPIEYREGGDPLTVRKIPGLNTYSNITLSRGITLDADLWNWRTAAANGAVRRANGSVILLDDSGKEVLRWNFREGWPSKWTGPSFNATGTEVAIEQLEIAHEGIVKG